jgi:hypothetical protein
MRFLFLLLAIAPLGIGVNACGGASKGTDSASRASTKPSQGYLVGDRDDDDLEGGYTADSDDTRVRDYGHEASTTDKLAVMSLVKRYYAAAAGEDGAGACALVYSRIAKGLNFTKVVPKEYVPAAGSSVFHGKNCAEVALLLFTVDHQQLVTDVTSLHVTGVRVKGGRGLVMLGFRTTGERMIAVKREGGVWKLGELLDSEIA